MTLNPICSCDYCWYVLFNMQGVSGKIQEIVLEMHLCAYYY